MKQQSQLTFEEFCKLPEKEKSLRYQELSDHDKFLARTSQVPIKLSVDTKALTEEELQKMRPDFQEILRKLQEDG